MNNRWSKNGLKTGSTASRTFFEENGCTVYQSYAAVIGFEDRDGKAYITSRRWSPTTIQHQSQLDRLLNATRVDHEEFLKLYSEATKPADDGLDHRPIFG